MTSHTITDHRHVTNDNKSRQPLAQAAWSLVLLAALLAALFVSWQAHRPFDYGYGFWYDQMAISEHIDRYGPRNRYIRGLEDLDRAEHLQLFGGIVDAVHQQGDGLEALEFTDDKRRTKRLLRTPEVVHLQDVANLIDVLTWVGWMAVAVAVVGTALLVRARVQIRWAQQGAILAGLAVALAALLLIVGPTAVFYQLHIWVFPEEHQWFFYYQDSLMSTMMKAPDLFGGIGATIGALGVCIYLMYLKVLSAALKRVVHSR